MARCPLVRPETVRVSLPDGEWLELAKELTAGEQREVFASQFKESQVGERMAIDLRQLGMNQILAYVKEWSFVDFQGEPLSISEDWLKKFDMETFKSVLKAVEDHDEAVEKAVEARKNVPATGQASSATS